MFRSVPGQTTFSSDLATSAQQSDPAGFAIEWPLVCPDCRTPLRHEPPTYRCSPCGKNYAVEDGVIRFVNQDAFYEERYSPLPLNFQPNERSLWGRGLLYLVSMHYLWYIRKYVPRGSKILDVACGAGMRYLPTLGQVAGLEISFSSARQMARLYNLSLQASAGKIPLAEGAVDAVVSRFFLEHIAAENKLPLLREFRRVLKPGGVLVTLQDCECNNRLWRWARQDAALFQQRFIENDGHYGLMYPSENLRLFQGAGFEVISLHGANKTPLVSLSMLQWMQPYRAKSRLANFLLAVAAVVSRHSWLSQAYTLGLAVWDDMLEKFWPLDHARYLLCACRRRDAG